MIYSVQHHELLKEQHIQKAGKIAVNLHLAPLPEYRGCNQFSFALMDEAPEFGVTIHEIDTRIDHGAILFQKRFPVPENCWVKTLYDLAVEAALQLFKTTLPALRAGDYQKHPQTEQAGQRPASLHYRSEINRLKQIDLNQGRTEIEKQIRATSMPGFEPPYCLIGGKRIYFNGDTPQ
jgi:methionyl-tRNA formyltransferase